MAQRIIGKGSKTFIHKMHFRVPRHFYKIRCELINIKLQALDCTKDKILAHISYTPILFLGSFDRAPRTKIKGLRQEIKEEIPIIKCVYDNCCEKISSDAAQVDLEFSKQPQCIASVLKMGRGRFSETKVDLIIKGEIRAIIKERDVV